jgi:glycerol-3-phosphate dehydrogenase (NAD+)
MARIVAHNSEKHKDLLGGSIKQWVFEMSNPDGTLNSSWTPWEKMRANTVPCATLEETVKGATLIIICLPHQFIAATCRKLKSFLRRDYVPHVLSMVKGVLISDKGIELVSTTICKELDVPTCSVLVRLCPPQH